MSKKLLHIVSFRKHSFVTMAKQISYHIYHTQIERAYISLTSVESIKWNQACEIALVYRLWKKFDINGILATGVLRVNLG